MMHSTLGMPADTPPDVGPKRHDRAALVWIGGLLIALAVFITVNFFIWFFGINLMFMPYPNCGDLARMSLAPGVGQCREEDRTLPRHVEAFSLGKTQEIVALSTGDSISRGRGGGTDNYWQDFVTARTGVPITWIPEITDNNYTRNIVLLHNSGFLKKYKVKYLIMQASERAVVGRLTADVDWNETMPLGKLEDTFTKGASALNTDPAHINAWAGEKLVREGENPWLQARAMLLQFAFMNFAPVILAFDDLQGAILKWEGFPDGSSPLYERVTGALGLPPKSFILEHPFSLTKWLVADDPAMRPIPGDGQNAFMGDGSRTSMAAALNNNYKWMWFSFDRLFKIDNDESAATRQTLNRDLFSGPYGNQLLFHRGDLRAPLKMNDAAIFEMHDNLNRLADLLAEDGITLYFMPSPNKLTAYEDYLVNPPAQKSYFFQRVRALPDKRYTFIDTESVVRRMVAAGEKDVYFIDDTHWSGRALPEIARLFTFPPVTAAKTD